MVAPPAEVDALNAPRYGGSGVLVRMSERCGWLAVGLVLAAAPVRAQDWLVTPAPAVPLHVPAVPTPPSPLPPMPPAVVIPAPAPAASHPPDAVQRLLDPYGLGLTLRSSATHPPSPPLLPSVALSAAPNSARRIDEAASRRTNAPPLVAFPNIPIAWLLGF